MQNFLKEPASNSLSALQHLVKGYRKAGLEKASASRVERERERTWFSRDLLMAAHFADLPISSTPPPCPQIVQWLPNVDQEHTLSFMF